MTNLKIEVSEGVESIDLEQGVIPTWNLELKDAPGRKQVKLLLDKSKRVSHMFQHEVVKNDVKL
jgi:hypothetical protein